MATPRFAEAALIPCASAVDRASARRRRPEAGRVGDAAAAEGVPGAELREVLAARRLRLVDAIPAHLRRQVQEERAARSLQGLPGGRVARLLHDVQVPVSGNHSVSRLMLPPPCSSDALATGGTGSCDRLDPGRRRLRPRACGRESYLAARSSGLNGGWTGAVSRASTDSAIVNRRRIREACPRAAAAIPWSGRRHAAGPQPWPRNHLRDWRL